jgi:HEPN domain-containing protein
MCQQAIEKVMKALYVQEHQQTPPYTHNLIRLLGSLSFSNEVAFNDRDFFERLNTYYLESRYSETVFEFYKTITQKQASDIYVETKRLYQWLLDKIL